MITILEKIRSFLSKNIRSQQTESTQPKENTNFFDILISLDKELNTNISLSIKDHNYNPMSETEYSLICSEFLSNTFTEPIVREIVNILNKDIISSDNFGLIKKIDILSKYGENLYEENSFIKPSEVFSLQQNNMKNNA